MAKRPVWEETVDGYAVLITGNLVVKTTPRPFIAYAEDTGQQFHRRAFYRKRADAMRARREELSQFRTQIVKATLIVKQR